MPERGEFTRKFDRDILGDKTAEEEERAAQQLALRAEDEALEREFGKLLAILEYRSKWLRDRFPRCFDRTEGVAFRGRRFEFQDAAGKAVGWIEFRVHLTDSQQGICIESYMELEGRFGKKHDYVNFPKERVNLDRAKRFVEAKLMEFAGAYQDSEGSRRPAGS